MNPDQIKQAVLSYLTATGCQLLEVLPEEVTVKLSPEADKELTNRPYYWGFIERTNTPPETFSYRFVFEPEAMQGMSGQLDLNTGIRTIHLSYGHSMLAKIMQAIKMRGQYVCLYEQVDDGSLHYTLETVAYTSWLVVNYKLEFVCEMKREECHSLGISLSTGEIAEQFHNYVTGKSLTPKMPAHTHLRETISLKRAKRELDDYMMRIINDIDHQWATKAHEWMNIELKQVADYYDEQLKFADDETMPEIEAQYRNRLSEVEWQYKPRIVVAPIQCGLFHLL